MLSTISGPIRRLTPALIAVVALAAGLALPAAPAASQSKLPEGWIGFALTADFSATEPKIEYTVFHGENGPPARVIKSDSDDITADCTFTDITYSGGYAVFNGSSSKIVCELPALADKVAELYPSWPALEPCLTCLSGEGPLWASAELIHDRAVGSNPIVDARNFGMIFSAPSNGAGARTQLQLSSGSLQSGGWTPSGSGNRMLIGMNGPAIIALDHAFHWLSYLNPAWQTPFESVAGPSRTGHWLEPGNSFGRVAAPVAYEITTTEGMAVFGYNADTGEYFDGRMRFVRIDPGCPGF